MEKRYKKDIALVSSLALLGFGFAGILFVCSGEGEKAVVRVGGRVVASYALERDADVVIEGADGGTNHLVIQDKKARITEASCPDGLCVKTGEISRTGQSVVCLPNQVVVEIVGGGSGREDVGYDVLTE